MNLDDLAYALWLRSDLSKWRVPGGHHDPRRFTRSPDQPLRRRPAAVQRARAEPGARGAAGRQRDARADASRLRRSPSAARRSPTAACTSSIRPIPGATTFADVYRDFFEPSFDDTVTGLRAQRETVGLRPRRQRARRDDRPPAAESRRRTSRALKPGNGVVGRAERRRGDRRSTCGAPRTRCTRFRCRCRRAGSRCGAPAAWPSGRIAFVLRRDRGALAAGDRLGRSAARRATSTSARARRSI